MAYIAQTDFGNPTGVEPGRGKAPASRGISVYARTLSSRALVVALFAAVVACSQGKRSTDADSKTNRLLPLAAVQGGPLVEALRNRHTSRDYDTKPLERQTLSNLLWAAYGVNRPDGKRTAPSAHDWQNVDVYVADSSGLYLFDAKSQDLARVKSGDIRAKTGVQDFVTVAPISLVYVSDDRKSSKDDDQNHRLLFAATTVGAIVQNVYLFCAANGLNTGVRADIDRTQLQTAMGLSPEQYIVLAQSVGYPPLWSRIKSTTKSALKSVVSRQ